MTEAAFSIGSDTWPGVSKLVEECGELVQVLGKLVATGGERTHWDGSDLRSRLIDELGDVRAAIAFLESVNDLPGTTYRAEAKYRLFHEWHSEGDRLPSVSPEDHKREVEWETFIDGDRAV